MIMPLTLSLAPHRPVDALLRTALPAARGWRPCRSPWRLKEGAAPLGVEHPARRFSGRGLDELHSSGPCWPSSCSQPQGWMEGRGRPQSPSSSIMGRDVYPSCHKDDRAPAGLWQIIRTLGAPTPRTTLPGPREALGMGWDWEGWQGLPRRVDLSFLNLAQQNPATSWPSPSPGSSTLLPALRPGQHTSTHLQVPGGLLAS